MKLIHTADLHLDSKMESNLPKEKALQRKNEILETFKRMVSYAADNDVEGILISGDLFDKSSPSKFAQNIVISAIKDNKNIKFFYLKGNHDEGSFFETLEEYPENLLMFSDEWEGYEFGDNVVITGVNMGKDKPIYSSLTLDTRKINIVMLHGQESSYKSGDKAEEIALSELKNKGIDYLALGHVHFYKNESLDGRGVYCYPGCLEGRGFDECGVHGFVLLDIDEEKKKVVSTFIPFAFRQLFELRVNVSEALTTADVEKIISDEIESRHYSNEALVKIVLEGAISIEAEINEKYLEEHFSGSFYFTKIKNETTISIDYEAYASDQSLKGEFVRTVKADNSLSEEEKALVIKTGIDALRGNR